MAALLMPQLPPSPPDAPASLSTVFSGVDAAAATAVGEAVVAVAKEEENAIEFVSTATMDRDLVVVSRSEKVEAARAELSCCDSPRTRYGQEKITKTAKRQRG